MFYFLWHDKAEHHGLFDVTRILSADPLAMQHPMSPPWGPLRSMHYWGEPLFGYYLESDPWVLRKHAQMLSDAGVDTIIFDTSNRRTYRENYTALMSTYRQMRAEGNRTPQVAFLTPFGDPKSTVRELYDQLYSRGEFSELWFRWEGKPLILADPAKVDADARNFFTFRRPQPDYFQGPTAPDMWSWLEVYPQHVFKNARGEKEQMSVGVAQNAVDGRLGSMSEPGSRGRSFHAGRPATRPSDVDFGYNFAEQWERAINEDPQLIFVTGWNEWAAGRFDKFNGIQTPPMFVDEFDQEHSRDIEPMRGGHGDDYYYQLVTNIRRYKGGRASLPASAEKTIPSDDASGPVPRAWDDVMPEFLDDLCDTAHRLHPGFHGAGTYRDDSGRNDLDLMKVARDANNLYFYVQTRESLKPAVSPDADDWMLLYLCTDPTGQSGWNGYDFLINRHRSKDNSCTIEKYVGDNHWQTLGSARLIQKDNRLQITIPRALLGLEPARGRLSFDFKWTDAIPPAGHPEDFLTKGDAAPNGRFRYQYRE